VNKQLMGAQGYAFKYVVTLNSLHFLTVSAAGGGRETAAASPSPRRL